MNTGQFDGAPFDTVAFDDFPAPLGPPVGPTAFASTGSVVGIDPTKTTGTLQ